MSQKCYRFPKEHAEFERMYRWHMKLSTTEPSTTAPILASMLSGRTVRDFKQPIKIAAKVCVWYQHEQHLKRPNANHELAVTRVKEFENEMANALTKMSVECDCD